MRCKICGSNKTKPFFIKDEHTFVKCFDCGVVFQKQVVDKIADFYSEEYFSEDCRNESQFVNWVQEDEIRRKIKLIKKYKTIGKILDVGCGYGYFLNFAKKAGYDVYGFEPNKYAVSRAKALFDLDIFPQMFNTENVNHEKFDIITAFHLVEHLQDPLEFINIARNSLKSGGILMLETPNVASFNFKRMKDKWPYVLPDEHLYLFTPLALQNLLQKNGFSTVLKKISGPFLYNKNQSIKKQSRNKKVSWKFKLLKKIYYFMSEKFYLGDHFIIVCKKTS